MKNTSPMKAEARFDRNKAARIWKKVASKESSLNLLRALKSENLGTKNVENFLLELRGEKLSKPKITLFPGGVSQDQKQQNKIQNHKNIKSNKNHKNIKPNKNHKTIKSKN